MAISPIPIIAVILMLFSKPVKSSGLAFLAGWVLALTIVGAVVLVLASTGKVSAGGTPSTLSCVVHLLLGLLLLFLAVRNWQKRPQEGGTPEMPKWDDVSCSLLLSAAQQKVQGSGGREQGKHG